jgi:hypothetical protein
LPLKFVIKANKTQKTQNLLRISIALKKLQKTHAKMLSTKKLQKNGVIDFYYCVQKFSAYNFFVIYLDLFQQIQTRHQNFAFYDTHIKLWGGRGRGGIFLHTLNWQFLLTLQPKSDETAQKNEKCIL